MSQHYEYNFIDASQLFAKIKEELKSYFDTGAIDDLMFPIWTMDCLKTLGIGSFPMHDVVLYIDDFQATLPSDFISVREAWACTQSGGVKYTLPGAYYKAITLRISDDRTPVDSCNPVCNPCAKKIEMVYKTTTEVVTNSFLLHYLLTPGNISTRGKCDSACENLRVQDSVGTFDIKSNKFRTSFREGEVYLKYYSSEFDEDGTPVVPDNKAILNYIENYIKYKLFYLLWNQTVDETFNQIDRKYQLHAQMMNDSLVTAMVETKKKTVHQKVQDIKRAQSRHNKYNIR